MAADSSDQRGDIFALAVMPGKRDSMPVPILSTTVPIPQTTTTTPANRPGSKNLRDGSVLAAALSNDSHPHYQKHAPAALVPSRSSLHRKTGVIDSIVGGILDPSPPSPKLASRKSTTFSIHSSSDSSSTTPTAAQSRGGSQHERRATGRRHDEHRLSASSVFNKDDRRYRCCCGGRLHIRHAALIIGVIECLIATGNMVAAVCLDAEYGQRAQPMAGVQTEAYLVISVVSMGLFVGTLGWMAFASARRKRVKRSYLHLIPHMVVQVLTIVMLTCALIAITILAFHSNTVRVVVDVFVLAFLAICLGIELFFFALVLRCYHYLRDEYELSTRPMPTCVVVPVRQRPPSVQERPRTSSILRPNRDSAIFPVQQHQPEQTYWNVAADEYCVY